MRYIKDDKCFRNNWLAFYPKFDDFYFMFNVAGYFDRRPNIHCFLSQILSLILLSIIGFHWYSFFLIVPFIFCWGSLYIDLPFKTDYDECDPPRYGIYYHAAGIWICTGKKIKCFHLPYDYVWVRTSVLLKDGTWEHDTKKERKDFYKDEWKKKIWSKEYSYTYVLKKGTIQNRIATIKVEEREWRQRWLKWTDLFAKKSKSIDVNFSYGGPFKKELLIEKKINGFFIENEHSKHTGEVGESTGGWKGGTLGCGYEMKPGETPLETLRRMECERKFN